MPEREFNGPTRGWQELYRDGIAALGADFSTSTATSRTAACARNASSATLFYEHACEGAYGPPEYGGNRDLAGWRAIEFPGDVPAARLHRRRSAAAVPDARDCDAVIIGTGPAGATAADVLTGAGWSVIMLEKGRNHLLALDAPFGPLGHVSNDEIKFFRRHFLGPDPFLEPRTYRRDDDDGDRLVRGRGQQPAVDGRRRRLPRRRQAPALPRGRLQGALGARPDRGRRHRRLAGRLRRDGAVLRRGRAARRRRRARGREPVRGVAHRARTRCRRAPTCSARCSPPKPRTRLGYHPYPRADRRELGPVRRPARVQQLRVLRVLRLPDRRQGRSGRAAAQRAAHRPLRDPARVVSSSACCSTRRAARRAACATSTPTATRTR